MAAIFASAVSVAVVHHTRKAAGEDPVDEISGTLGLAGAVDAFMVIKTTAQGKLLHMRGRDIEEQEFAVKFIKENCKWEILGEPEVVQMSESRAKILDALKNSQWPMGPTEVALATGLKDKEAVSQLLYRMAKAGLVEKVGRGQVSTPILRRKSRFLANPTGVS